MRIRQVFFVALLVSVSGCTFLDRMMCTPNCGSAKRNSSSLVEFLYPKGVTPPPENAIPQLRVPLRVGLAFLPENGQSADALTAAQKEELLGRIRTRFRDRKFVTEIVVIPDYYLKNVRGFAGLEGVQRLYSVDLMALVSYDQVTHLNDNKLSLSYLTIVGAYVVKGSRHDTTTLVDLAVVDPVTRSLVLRAGGTDTRDGNATLVDEERESRRAAAASFDSATGHLIDNFDRALVQFEADVRAGKANVRVAQRNQSANTQNAGNGGGGAFTWVGLLPLLLLAALRFRGRPSVM